MTEAERLALSRLERLALGLGPMQARAYRRALAAIADGATIEALAKAIDQGGEEAVVRLLLNAESSAAATEAIRKGLLDGITAGAATTARTSPALRTLVAVFRPGLGFPEAEDAALSMAVDRYRVLQPELADGFRGVVREGLAQGLNPRQVATAVKSFVGGTAYDAQIIASFRRQLQEDPATALQRTLRDRRFDGPIRRALASGRPIPAADIERYVAGYEKKLLAWRAETWARTSALDAARQGQVTAWRAAIARGVVTGPLVKRWVTRLDGRERPGHAEANGQTVDFDGTFFDPSINASVEIPGQGAYNCFVPETQVEGAIRTALRTRYSGPLCEIVTASGHRLTCTPNHPILTTVGFIPAGLLNDSYQVLTKRTRVDGATLPGFPNHQHEPSSIEQIFDALAAQGVSRREGLGRHDLHGDAVLTDGYVEVVATNGSLLNHHASHLHQQAADDFNNRSLSTPQQSARPLVGDSLSSQLTLSRGTAAPRTVGGGDLATHESRVRLDSAPLGALCIGSASHWNISLAESAKENAAVAPALVRELLHAASGEIALDNLIEVRKIDFSHGWVYDVETASGITVANGVIASNCRCAFIVRPLALADL